MGTWDNVFNQPSKKYLSKEEWIARRDSIRAKSKAQSDPFSAESVVDRIDTLLGGKSDIQAPKFNTDQPDATYVNHRQTDLENGSKQTVDDQQRLEADQQEFIAKSKENKLPITQMAFNNYLMTKYRPKDLTLTENKSKVDNSGQDPDEAFALLTRLQTLQNDNPNATITDAEESYKSLGEKGTENVINSIYGGVKQIGTAYEDYYKAIKNGDPTTAIRGTGKAISGLLQTGISALPPMIALNFAQPLINEMAKDTATSLGFEEGKGEKVANLLTPLIFGKAVAIGSVASHLAEWASDPILQSVGLNEEDKELAKNIIANAAFFFGAAKAGKLSKVAEQIKTEQAKKPIEILEESKTVVEDVKKQEAPAGTPKLPSTEPVEPQSPVKGTEVKQEGKEAVKEEIDPISESKKRKEQSRLETEKLNKQFEQQAIKDELEMDIADRVESKIKRGAELTKEESDYFAENQYAPKGYKYDTQGNLVKNTPKSKTKEETKSKERPNVTKEEGKTLLETPAKVSEAEPVKQGSKTVGNDLVLMHGTPHNFDKFSLEKIGTGEGQQAFGYGLYFTDGSDLAKSYAKKLSDDKTGIVYEVKIKDGAKKEWVEWREPLDESQETKLYDSLTKEERNVYEKHLDKSFSPDSKDYDINYTKDYHGSLDELKTDKYGNVSYEQPTASGNIYQDMKDAFGQKKATEIFKRAGIDGIKYRSRKGLGDETNYVVFDANSIEITKKSSPSKDRIVEQTGTTGTETPVSKEPLTTGIKNAITDKERAERGASPIENEARKVNEVVWDEAKTKVDKGVIDVPTLADEVINKPRNLSDVENGALLYDKIRLQKAFRDTMDKIDATKDIEQEMQLRIEAKSIEGRLDKIDMAAKKSGTEWGRSGQFRQRLAREDYSLDSMLRKYKSVTSSKEVPQDVRKRFEDYDKKIRGLEKQIEDFSTKEIKRETDIAFAKIKREASYQLRKEKRTITKAELDTEFTSLSKELLKATGQLNIGLDPTVATLIGKMAINRAKSGIVSLEGTVDAIYTSLAEKISKEDIKKAILDYKIETSKERANKEKINDLQSKINKIESSDNVTKAQKTYTTRLKNQIALLEKMTSEMKETGKPIEKPKPRQTPLNEELVELQGQISRVRKLYDKELELAKRKNWTKKEKFNNAVAEIINLPRAAFMTVLDMSAPLRQGKWMTAAHPIQGLKAGKEMMKSFFSPKAYEKLENYIEFHPNQKYFQKHGLDITEIGNFTKQEERFMSSYAEKIPIWGKYIVKPSERAYNAYLNKMRVDVFSQTLKALRDNGLNLDSKEARPKLDALAELINNSTGRGNLGKTLRQAQPLLNGILFSPRNIAGNLRMIQNMVNPKVYKEMLKGDPVAKESMRQIWSLIGAGTAIVGLAEMAGADVERDPSSSDFMKIKLGNTRIDIWGGLQQYLVYFYRMMQGEIKSTSGKKSDLPEKSYPFRTRGSISQDFIVNKFSPQMSLLWGALNDTDDGSYKDFMLDREIQERVTPLAVRDMYLAAEENGLVGAGVSIPAFFGAGIQTFEPTKNDPKQKRIKQLENLIEKYPQNAKYYERQIERLK